VSLPLRRWTPEQVRALGVVTTVEVAGEVLGLRRGATYHAIRRGVFPVPVLKISQRRWVVPVAALLRVLEVEEPGDAEGADPSSAPSVLPGEAPTPAVSLNDHPTRGDIGGRSDNTRNGSRTGR
jgi:hypothetical protein